MDAPFPFSLVAEITHRCPLHCVYCSNPLELKNRENELATKDWLRVLDEAHALGVVQLHLSGGEPLLRPDLEELVRHAEQLEFYTNLITSGIGLTPQKAQALASSGLDNIQLSFQAATPTLNDGIGGRKTYAEKLRAAEAIREANLAFTMNVVFHRLNLDQIDEIIDLCASLGAKRLELANTQFYGWALLNQQELMPTREQLVKAEAIYNRKKCELKGKMELIWVISDYYEPFPKPCMGGWGQIHMTIAPDGMVLPCPVASTIKTLRFENVKERNLGWIWRESPSFNKFRGFDWMPDPCWSCDRRFQDFGGCRCQAFALTGEAARTDPVCQWSPDHHIVEASVLKANERRGGDALPDNLDKQIFKQLTFRTSPSISR